MSLSSQVHESNYVAQECLIIPMTVVNVVDVVFLFHSTEAVAEWSVQN